MSSNTVDPAISSTLYGRDLQSCIENLPAFNFGDIAYTQPPNPGWKFGRKVEETEEGRKWVEGEKQGWKRIDTDGEDWT
jgi:hypothetical protein